MSDLLLFITVISALAIVSLILGVVLTIRMNSQIKNRTLFIDRENNKRKFNIK